MKKAWDVLVPALILLIALAVRWIDPLPVEYLRNVTFDSYQRLKPRVYNPDLPVRIATIDEKSLKLFGQWPWPRTRMAQIIDRLAELGAAVVGVDILFAEPDRTSPEAIMNQLPDTPALRTARQALAQMPDNDSVFADALRKVPVVLAFALQNADPHRPQAKPMPIGGFVYLGDDPRQFVTSYPYIVLPLAKLRAAAAGIGVVNAVPDIDGIIRRIPLVQLYRDQLVPSLVSEALRLAGGGPSYLLRSAKTTSEGVGSLLGQGVGAMRIGSQFRVTTTGSAEMLLYDTGTKPQRFFSIADLMDPSFDRNQVEGRVILIGSTVEGLKDSRPSPITRDMSGVEFHAQTIEQVLAANLLGEPQLARPYWAFGAELLYLTVTGVLTIFILRRRGALTGLLLALNVLAVALAGSWYLFSREHFLIDPIYPGLVVFLIFVAGTLANFVRTESEKRHVRNAFSLYLSPVMVDQLSQNPQRLSLGGEIRNLTVMFCDVRGFTKISESLDPQSLTQLMNRFLTPMTRSIQAHQGTIDKYIGDCIMAFWNAPLDVPQHGRHALMAAFEMRRVLHHLNAALKAEAEQSGKAAVELQIGIGLNSGPGCVGNMGSEQRLTYSVLGDTVNIASRLEALSPRYGVDLVVGEETAEAAPDFALLELDQVRVKGRQEPVRIFTALGDRAIADSTEFMKLRLTHDALLAAYRNRDWSAARAALEACREVMPTGLAAFYDLYAERLAEFQEMPPAPDWDGVYIARSKTG